MCKTIGLFVAALALSSSLAQTARADGDLGETQRAEYLQKLNEEFATYLADLNKTLGLAEGKGVKGEYVDKTFPNRVFDNTMDSTGLNTYLRGACTYSVRAVHDAVIDSERTKKAVAAKVKRIDCAYGGKTKDKFAVVFTNGRILVSVSEAVNGSDTRDKVKELLKKRL